ncbi:MAG: peptidoglycan DD-metalloendopeptidase family protein [Oscillospiraceae bacterium]|nr:peptidoglycan DD-metalloendopeptidase family protein [Oscillospiraceae bacterium]
MKRIFLIMLCCATVLASVNYYAPAISSAASRDEEIQALKDKSAKLDLEIAKAQKRINELKDDKSNQKVLVDEYNAQLDALQEQIDVFDEKIKIQTGFANEIQAEITALNNQIAEIDAEIKIIDDAIAECEKNIEETYEILSRRLRAIYMNGESSEIEILLTADSLSTFLMRLELASGVARRDAETVNGLKDNIKMREEQIAGQKKAKADLETAKQTHSEKKKVHTDKITEIENEKTVVETHNAEFQKKLDAVSAELKKLESDSRYFENQISKWEDEKDKYADKIDDLLHNKASTIGSTPESTPASGLIWPLSPASDTYVSSGYRTSKRPNHTGVDLCYNGSSQGKKIIASGSGKVIEASYHGAYGNCMVIDHGNGLSTLYAHCSSFAKSVGSNVTKGETIAYIGSTGRSTGPHLHFEVRINTSGGIERKSPLNYVSK